MQALAVGWSIYWRQALWTVCGTLVAVPLFYLASLNPDRMKIYLGMGLMLVAFYGVVFPRTILRVLQIRYSDFRLQPRRTDNNDAEVRYWEAAVLSAAVNLVPMLGGPVLQLYVGAVPLLGSFVVAVFPILVGMPLAGWLLTGIRIFGLRIEIEDSLI